MHMGVCKFVKLACMADDSVSRILSGVYVAPIRGSKFTSGRNSHRCQGQAMSDAAAWSIPSAASRRKMHCGFLTNIALDICMNANFT
jgi:hypothetical protein